MAGLHHKSLLALIVIAITAAALKIPTPTLLAAPCTTYITSSLFGFRGVWQQYIVKTIYTTTVTQTIPVPCGGCSLAFTTMRAPIWGGIGPVELVKGSTTAKLPTIVFTTVCAASINAHILHGPSPSKTSTTAAVARQRIALDMAVVKNIDCTYTRVVPVNAVQPGVATVFTKTATITSHIDCSGCNHVAVATLNGLHPGPVMQFTKTTTALVPSNTTVFQCLKTPSVVLPTPTQPVPVRPHLI